MNITRARLLLVTTLFCGGFGIFIYMGSFSTGTSVQQPQRAVVQDSSTGRTSSSRWVGDPRVYEELLEEVFNDHSKLNYSDVQRGHIAKLGYSSTLKAAWVLLIESKVTFHWRVGDAIKRSFDVLESRYETMKRDIVGMKSDSVMQRYDDLLDQVFHHDNMLDFYTAERSESRVFGHAATVGAEDLLIYYLFFCTYDRGGRSFKFLDVGAGDGMTNSRTFFFENSQHWQGFLVEANADHLGGIAARRNLTRSRVACPKAVCRTAGFVHLDNGKTSDINSGSDGGVPCDTMADIIRSLNSNEDLLILHFWSLNCGGCEDVALETFDWSTMQVAVLLVAMEQGKSCGGHPERCTTFLASHGMELWGRTREHQEIWYSTDYFWRLGGAPTKPSAQIADGAGMTGKAWFDLFEKMSIFTWEVGHSIFNDYNGLRASFEKAREEIDLNVKLDWCKRLLEEVFEHGSRVRLDFHRTLKSESDRRSFDFATLLSWMQLLGQKIRFHMSVAEETLNVLSALGSVFQQSKQQVLARSPLENARAYGNILGRVFCCESHLDFYIAQAAETRKIGHAATFGGEDLFLYYLFFASHDRTDGSFKFLEIGADDGLSGSSTFFFETLRNWQGFLVEPSPSQCEHINHYRDLTKVKVACPKAVCRNPGHVRYFGGGKEGGTAETLAKDVLKKRYDGASAKSVACDTMAGVLRGLQGGRLPPVLHFWSLNCEGCEDVALETFDWGSVMVAVLMVMMVDGINCGGTPKRCEQFLRTSGMRYWGDGPGHVQIWYSEKYFSQPEHPLPRLTDDTKPWFWYLEQQSHLHWEVGSDMFNNYRTLADKYENGKLNATPQGCLDCRKQSFDYSLCKPDCVQK